MAWARGGQLWSSSTHLEFLAIGHASVNRGHGGGGTGGGRAVPRDGKGRCGVSVEAKARHGRSCCSSTPRLPHGEAPQGWGGGHFRARPEQLGRRGRPYSPEPTRGSDLGAEQRGQSAAVIVKASLRPLHGPPVGVGTLRGRPGASGRATTAESRARAVAEPGNRHRSESIALI